MIEHDGEMATHRNIYWLIGLLQSHQKPKTWNRALEILFILTADAFVESLKLNGPLIPYCFKEKLLFYVKKKLTKMFLLCKGTITV